MAWHTAPLITFPFLSVGNRAAHYQATMNTIFPRRAMRPDHLWHYYMYVYTLHVGTV